MLNTKCLSLKNTRYSGPEGAYQHSSNNLNDWKKYCGITGEHSCQECQPGEICASPKRKCTIGLLALSPLWP